MKSLKIKYKNIISKFFLNFFQGWKCIIIKMEIRYRFLLGFGSRWKWSRSAQKQAFLDSVFTTLYLNITSLAPLEQQSTQTTSNTILCLCCFQCKKKLGGEKTFLNYILPSIIIIKVKNKQKKNVQLPAERWWMLKSSPNGQRQQPEPFEAHLR